MSHNTLLESLTGGTGLEKPTDSTAGPMTKPSRRARNDQRWDSLKDEIRRIYIIDDCTLQNTKRIIEEKHAFKASERKWKEKLKEWRFDKNITATDMNFLVAKAEKRLHEEGKETIFFSGISQITRERIEQFKRRKLSRERENASPEGDTPKNITYYTPPEESPVSILADGEKATAVALESKECVPSFWFPYPRNGNSSFKTNDREAQLSTVQELSPDHWASEDGFSILGTDYSDVSDSNRLRAVIDEQDRLLGHELAAQMDRVISRMVENSSLRPSSPVVTHERFLSHPRRHDEEFDYVSVGAPLKLPVGTPISDGKGILPQRLEPFLVNDVETTHSFVEKKLDHPFLADKIVSAEDPMYSDESEGPISDTDSSDVSEKDMQTLLAEARLYFPRKQKALELRAKGWSMVEIFQHLLATGIDEEGLEFCRKLLRLCFFFEKEHLLEDALIGFEIVQAGYDIEFGAASKDTMRCVVHKARVLRKMKQHQDSEAFYRQAIAGFRALRQRSSQLKCQLALGNLLRSHDRDAGALKFLVGALIEHFNLPKTFEESQRVIELLDSIQKVHLKMELDPDLAESVSRLKDIQLQWIENPNYLKFWSEFVRIGAQYSRVEEFELADLCFAIPAPIWSPIFGSTTKIKVQLVRSSTELSMHYKRQGKLVKSIEALENALQHFSTILQQKSFERTDILRTTGLTDTVEQELFAILRSLIVDLRPAETPTMQDSHQIHSIWWRAEAAWVKLDRPAVQRKPIRNGRIDHLRKREPMQRRETESISSHGSSALSSGSGGSRIGITYSVGSASSVVSNSAFMVPT